MYDVLSVDHYFRRFGIWFLKPVDFYPKLWCVVTLPHVESDLVFLTMEAELQTYRDQLAYVNLSLEADPTKDDLLKLKNELIELIELTQTAIAQTSGSASKSDGASKVKGKGKETNWQDNGPYKAGMDCMAKYKDGKWLVGGPHCLLSSD